MMLSENGTCSLLVLNYNGRKILAESLPSVIESARYNNARHDVLVIDNNSTDDSVQFLKDTFPSVKVIEQDENRYLFSYNTAAAHCKSDYIILLNNDMKVTRNFIDPLKEKMKDDEMFSVMPNIRNWDDSNDKVESSKNKVCFKKGWMDWKSLEDEKEGIIFFTSAGAGLYNRKKFLELGGFDELYFPGYVEDVDISYRAWRRGWISYYAPDSVVFHKNSYTMKQHLSDKDIWALKIRNKYLFFWKNIQDRKLWQEHIKYIPMTLVASLIRREITPARGLYQAIKLVKKLRCRAITEPMRYQVVSDKDILEMFCDGESSQET